MPPRRQSTRVPPANPPKSAAIQSICSVLGGGAYLSAAGSVVTSVQLPAGVVPAFLAAGGYFDAGWRVLVASREGRVYTVKASVARLLMRLLTGVASPEGRMRDPSPTVFRKLWPAVTPPEVVALARNILSAWFSAGGIMVGWSLARGESRN